MSAEKVAEYRKRLQECPSEAVRNRLMLEAARDKELTTPEVIRLDEWRRGREEQKWNM